MAAIRAANPATVSFGGGLFGGLMAGIAGTLLFMGALQNGAPSDVVTGDPGRAAVERSLVAHRASERGSALEPTAGLAGVEAALVEHRAGERGASVGETFPTRDAVNGR